MKEKKNCKCLQKWLIHPEIYKLTNSMVPSIILSFEEMVQNNGWPKNFGKYGIIILFFFFFEKKNCNEIAWCIANFMEDRENDYIQFS